MCARTGGRDDMLVRMDAWDSGLTSRARLLATGFTDRELDRARRTRELVAVRPGAYLASADERLRTPETRHLLVVAATVPRLAADAVVSHVSAAVVHGLPVWQVPLHRVHATRRRSGGGRRGSLVCVHAAALERDEIVEIGGIAVTSVARTVVDLARSLPFEEAVAVADGALHRGRRARSLVQSDLVAVLDRAPSRPGSSAARRVVAFADGRSESVGESISRVRFARAGLPAPELQREVWSAEGAFLGRVDFYWEEQNTVGEFDGKVKYGRLMRRGQDPREVLWEEKRREDALRDTGKSVARWVWSELATFDTVAARVSRAFARP